MDRFRLAVFNTQPPQLYFGGVERRIIETAKRLQNQADITIYCGTKAGFKKPETIEGAKFVPCYSTDTLFPLDNWFFNRSLIKSEGIFGADVYEAHAVSGYGFPKALKKRCINKPFIHTIHGVLADEYERARNSGSLTLRGKIANYYMKRLANLEAKTAKNATLIVTPSKYSLQKIKQHYKIEEEKIRVIPNGVDVVKFQPSIDKGSARRQFGLGSEPVVLFVGSLIPRKGLPFLVEAAGKIVRENGKVRFVVAGEGPLKNQLVAKMEKANMSSNFMFLGNINDEKLPALYNCADVFVLPSIQEGQGIVLLEAQASGKPVVVFDVGGVGEAVRNGETGLLVKSGDSKELADALLRLLSDGALREKMGLAGRSFVEENFTWDLCAKRMFGVYREALAK
jgi:glycosyltransferase involved in cell wall biosynthesis